MAPFFSTSNRPWDVKEPLRAYPQYRPASSSLGSGLRWSRTLLRVTYSHTTCAMRSCRKQPLSEWRSEAGAAFSVATRDEVQQVYISAAHSAAQCIVRTGPGPDYQYPSMLGKQVRLGFLAVAASRPLTPSVPSDPVHEEELLHTALHRSRPRCATPGVCRAWWGARSSDGNRREQAWEAGCGHGACLCTHCASTL